MGQKILINYASDDVFEVARKQSSRSAREVGGVDRVIEYSPKDLDEDFKARNKELLSQVRGAGYWLWKPYIILKTLQREDVREGNWVCYLDCRSLFVHPLAPLIDLCCDAKQFLFAYDRHGNTEKAYTKGDCFVAMDCDTPRYRDSRQRYSGFILLCKCAQSIAFFEEFLHYAKIPQLLTDAPSDHPNAEGFLGHRHDQSIFSLLAEKYETFSHPAPFGRGTHADAEADVQEGKRLPYAVISTRVLSISRKLWFHSIVHWARVLSAMRFPDSPVLRVLFFVHFFLVGLVIRYRKGGVYLDNASFSTYDRSRLGRIFDILAWIKEKKK